MQPLAARFKMRRRPSRRRTSWSCWRAWTTVCFVSAMPSLWFRDSFFPKRARTRGTALTWSPTGSLWSAALTRSFSTTSSTVTSRSSPTTISSLFSRDACQLCWESRAQKRELWTTGPHRWRPPQPFSLLYPLLYETNLAKKYVALVFRLNAFASFSLSSFSSACSSCSKWDKRPGGGWRWLVSISQTVVKK